MAKVSPTQFFREVRQEVSKVTWPSRKETILTTIMVFIMAVIAAVFFTFVDVIVSFVVNKILALGA